MLFEDGAKRHWKAAISHLLTAAAAAAHSIFFQRHNLDERSSGAVAAYDATVHVAEEVTAGLLAGKL